MTTPTPTTLNQVQWAEALTNLHTAYLHSVVTQEKEHVRSEILRTIGTTVKDFYEAMQDGRIIIRADVDDDGCWFWIWLPVSDGDIVPLAKIWAAHLCKDASAIELEALLAHMEHLTELNDPGAGDPS